MKRRPLYLILIALCAVAAVPLAISLVRAGLLSDVTAAWGQVAGAVWALAAAYGISDEGHRRDRQRRAQDRIAFLEVVLHLAHEARELADEAERSLAEERRIPLQDFEDVRELLDRLPTESMGSGRLALLVRQMRRLVRHLAEVYNVVGGRPVSVRRPELEGVPELRISRIRNHYLQIEELVDDLIKQAGAQ